MNKKPFVTLEQLEEITKTYPTPFYLYDEKGIRENAKALKEAFSWNPGYKEYFAVKATPNPFLINILREYGCGCDCSSMTELMLSHEIGVTGEDIMFSSNDTPAEEFAYAAEIGAIINLDDFTEVKKIEVGNNPNKIVAHAASGKLFVACWGDFYNNPNSLWTIDAASDEATDLQVSVTFMCISGDVLYTIYDSYNGPESVQYVAYNAEDNSVLDDTFIPVVTSNNGSEYNRVDSPAGITVNPADGHIFIASYVDDPVNAYILPSYVYEYNAQGEVQRRYDVGVGAANMLVLE